jgi:hypothetical protein
VSGNTGTSRRRSLLLLATALLILLGVSVSDAKTTEWFFVKTTYYLQLLTLLCWGGTHLHQARGVTREALVGWVRENWPGLVIAAAVTVVATLAVEPALRILSDEANLVGTSKNLFAVRTPTFTVSGKNYYGSYWDIDVAIDQRPTLFPFLVSLVHAVRGYSHTNVFFFNTLVLASFLLLSYRLAKSLAGETFGVVAAVLVGAHPITLITARSGSFDLLASCLGLLVLKSLLDVFRQPSPGKLVIAWMNLCVFAGVRYETALFLPPVIVLLLLFKLPTVKALRPYALIYVLTPVFLLPRLWQALLRGSVPAQEPGAVTFSAQNFVDNVHEYFRAILPPFDASPAHSAGLIALGVVGAVQWLSWLARRLRAGDWGSAQTRFAVLVLGWMLLQTAMLFTYVWGRAQYPSAARLFIQLDTFFSFAAAWVLIRTLHRCPRMIPVLLAVGTFLLSAPVAAQHRMMNRLTQSRESERTWRFFETLNEKRILIVTDRPNHFTIMNYGAMSFESAKNDAYLFTAHARRLFHDVYVIQQIKLSTGAPLPRYAIWPDRKLEPVLEFQNDADVLVRISRLGREPR